ncbi:MAG: hypothetical protein SGPRY_002229 [Prymnesium sp.]
MSQLEETQEGALGAIEAIGRHSERLYGAVHGVEKMMAHLESQIEACGAVGEGVKVRARVESGLLVSELRHCEGLGLQQTASSEASAERARIEQGMLTGEMSVLERRLATARKQAVRACQRLHEQGRLGEQAAGETEARVSRAEAAAAAAAAREAEWRMRFEGLKVEVEELRGALNEAGQGRQLVAEAQSKISKLEAKLGSSRAATRAAEAKLEKEKEQVAECIRRGLRMQLVALEAMRAELDAQTALLGRADQGGLSLVPNPHAGAPLSPALDREFLRLADSATSPRLVSLNGQLQSQEAVLTAELRVVEGQLHEERERRRDEVSGLLRVLEEEGARWKNAAAEGWATANRESRRKHASQLARMSAALSSNVLSGPSIGAYEDAHPIAGDDQGIDGTNRLFKSMSLHQLRSPSRLSYAMGTASTPQLDFGNNETNSILEPVSHDEMCTPVSADDGLAIRASFLWRRDSQNGLEAMQALTMAKVAAAIATVAIMGQHRRRWQRKAMAAAAMDVLAMAAVATVAAAMAMLAMVMAAIEEVAMVAAAMVPAQMAMVAMVAVMVAAVIAVVAMVVAVMEVVGDGDGGAEGGESTVAGVVPWEVAQKVVAQKVVEARNEMRVLERKLARWEAKCMEDRSLERIWEGDEKKIFAVADASAVTVELRMKASVVVRVLH